MKEKITMEYYTEVARRLKRIVKEKKMTEGDIVRKCRANGFSISQGAVSKLLSVNRSPNSSITLINCVQVCKALDVPVEAVLDHTRDGGALFDSIRAAQEGGSKRMPLVYNTEEDEFKGYLGLYHTYFFPTISAEDGLLHGELTFERSSSGEYCAARYKLDTGKLDGDGHPICKLYEGELIVSVRMNACYCSLCNTRIGEICFLTFHHMYLNNEALCCRLAAAVTVSAGDNRRPAMHRVLLSRRELREEELAVIKSQLLLNSTDILISTRSYEELCQNGLLPGEMLDDEHFIRTLPKEEYYSISESHIRALHLTRDEKVEALCALRGKSFSPKYNKIGSKCDEVIFEYLYGRRVQEKRPDSPASPL